MEAFFESYARTSLGDEPEKLAALYAGEFLASAPQGSAAFKNDERFLDWLRQVHDFNVRAGMRTLTVIAVDEHPLGDLHTLATVTWGSTFDPTGDRVITFDISYLLRLDGGTWKILAYVSHADQEEEMRRHGLMPTE